MNYAPIALFVYNRPSHTKQTIEALKLNAQAKESVLYIYSDAAKNDASIGDVAQVRDYIKGISGFAKVEIVEREQNWGLADSIIDGVTQLCNKHGRVIVLEDDLITSQHFLSYMNQCLDLYQDNTSIASVSGYMYPMKLNLTNDTVFLRFPMSWGWATWERAWKSFNSNSKELLQNLTDNDLLDDYNNLGPIGLVKMLKGNINGENDSWYIRWCTSVFLEKKLNLNPKNSLVKNIGIDGTGVHCAEWAMNPFNVTLSEEPLAVEEISLSNATLDRIYIKRFFLKVTFYRYLNACIRLLNKLKF